jgi:predicted RNA-binding Zn ribbon-like protein
MVENVIQTQIFEFTGGRMCLDFTNTVEDRPSDNPRELLNSYNDLLSWSKQAHLLTDQEAERLLDEALQRPSDASSILKRATELRETIYRIFKSVAEDASPQEEDLDSLNGAIAEAMAHTRIVPKAEGFTWDWDNDERKLDRMLWPVVRSAADILTSEELYDVRVCASDNCNWLFFDTSKNHSRRWCDMKSCGNRAKARRHYVRKKVSSVDSREG